MLDLILFSIVVCLVFGSRSYFIVDVCSLLRVVVMGLPTVSKAAMFPRPVRMRTMRMRHASVCFLFSYVNVSGM